MELIQQCFWAGSGYNQLVLVLVSLFTQPSAVESPLTHQHLLSKVEVRQDIFCTCNCLITCREVSAQVIMVGFGVGSSSFQHCLDSQVVPLKSSQVNLLGCPGKKLIFVQIFTRDFNDIPSSDELFHSCLTTHQFGTGTRLLILFAWFPPWFLGSSPREPSALACFSSLRCKTRKSLLEMLQHLEGNPNRILTEEPLQAGMIGPHYKWSPPVERPNHFKACTTARASRLVVEHIFSDFDSTRFAYTNGCSSHQ